MNTQQGLLKKSYKFIKLSNKAHKAKACANMSGAWCVLGIIQNSSEGVDPKTLKQRTGFKKRKVHKILYKLFKHGSIRIEGGGLYTGVKDNTSGEWN